jgi:hypothetical protein
MALYFARVQLSGSPTAQQYEALHAAMASIGFYPRIVGANGTTLNLPHATYASDRFTSADNDANVVNGVAGAITHGAEVLVTGSDWQAYGLKPSR